MSTLYQRDGLWYVGVPVHPTGWIKRATGTRNRALASSMARMMDELGPQGRREWALLDPVRDGTLSVATLHDTFLGGPGALELLKTQLNDIDVEPEVENWLQLLVDQVAPDTTQHYGTHVRSLIARGTPFPISRLTKSELANWLHSRKCGSPTKRKYRAAMSSFCQHLVELGKLDHNPMLLVRAPKANQPRMRYLEHGEVIRLIEAQQEPFRSISALMHATGMEISAVLRLKRSDIDTGTWMVSAHGTKTTYRDREVYVLNWARPYLLPMIANLLPGALVFPAVTRWAASDAHRAACKVVKIDDYTLRDSRHTFAVNATKAGVDAETIARQLGHANTQMVTRVYSRYQPSKAERARAFDLANDRAVSSLGGLTS